MKFFMKTKVVLVFMTVLTMLPLIACGNNDQAAADRIAAHLKEKYGEPFAVEAIGGGYGTKTNNTLKAVVHPEARSKQKFDAEISKDLKTVWDSYMNVIMSEKLTSSASDWAAPIFGGSIWVHAHISSPGFSSPDTELQDKNMEVKDYLSTSSNWDILIEIFVKSDSDVNTAEQAAKMDQFADRLLASGIKVAYVPVYYLKPAAFAALPDEYGQVKEVYKHYSQTERSYNTSSFEIKDGKKLQTVQQMKNSFGSKQ